MSSPPTPNYSLPALLLSPSIEPISPLSPDANATFSFDLDLRSPSPVDSDSDNNSRSFDHNQYIRSPSPIDINDDSFSEADIHNLDSFLQSSPRVDNESHSDFDIGEDFVSSSSSDTVVMADNVTNDDLMDIDNQSGPGSAIKLDNQTLTLHSFGSVPIAVRRLIWALNLPGPRLVEVIWKEGKQEDGWYSNAPIIVNLSICRESRLEALKTHPLSFACDASLARIPFNFETDALLLGRKMAGTHQIFKKERVGNDLAKVQFLVVDAALKWGKRGRYDRGYGNFGHISHLIFNGVKEHTVLYTGNTDPLPSWADSHWFRRIVWQRWQHHNPAQVIDRFKQNWPHPPGRIQLHPDDAEKFKYGGIPAEEKFDPSISHWRVPKVFSFGVTTRVSDGFAGSVECNWPMILMDRVIEDIFT